MVFAQDPAATRQGVLVQVAGRPHVTQHAQVGSQARRRGQSIWVVLAQDAAAALQGVLVQVAG